MSIIYQESAYQAQAKPERKKIFSIIPCPICKRISSSYGYAQAINATWEEYVKDAGGWFSDRSDFNDAIDFVGWYNYKSHKKLGIPKSNAKALYLAYHEGWKGYRNGTYKKNWLTEVADQVYRRAKRYNKQYKECQKI